MIAKRTVDWELLRERTKLASAADPSATDLTAIFAERAVALARVGGERTDAARSTLLCFSHSERTFAVELSSVARVLRARKLTRIPRAPRQLDRVFQESGRIVAAWPRGACRQNWTVTWRERAKDWLR